MQGQTFEEKYQLLKLSYEQNAVKRKGGKKLTIPQQKRIDRCAREMAELADFVAFVPVRDKKTRRKPKGKTKARASKKKKAQPRKMTEAERWHKDPFLRSFTV
jgi:hypothetical protein